jgi:hypothetical protein
MWFGARSAGNRHEKEQTVRGRPVRVEAGTRGHKLLGGKGNEERYAGCC